LHAETQLTGMKLSKATKLAVSSTMSCLTSLWLRVGKGGRRKAERRSVRRHAPPSPALRSKALTVGVEPTELGTKIAFTRVLDASELEEWTTSR
jgi:hypothetical protein